MVNHAMTCKIASPCSGKQGDDRVRKHIRQADVISVDAKIKNINRLSPLRTLGIDEYT